MPAIHPYYEAHRTVMEASMRQRLDIVSEMFEARLGQTEAVAAKQEIMSEFEVVLGQMPYVGGAASRMSDFFMRLMGFMAIGRVLQRRGVPTDAIGEIELESFQRQMLTVPEGDRMQAGRQFMSPENRALMREQAAESQKKTYDGDFIYDYVEPGPNDNFEFGVNYRACGFCQFAGRHGDLDILKNICGLDFAAYELRGIHLERTQTLAGGASHCNFRFTSKPDLRDKK
jgi:hypothetical protein